jgi:hypothetical protein
MLLVCKKYLLDDLFKSIKWRLHRIKISRENLFEFLKVVDQWKGLLGFEQICAELTRKCAVQIKKSFKTSQVLRKCNSSPLKISDILRLPSRQHKLTWWQRNDE